MCAHFSQFKMDIYRSCVILLAYFPVQSCLGQYDDSGVFDVFVIPREIMTPRDSSVTLNCRTTRSATNFSVSWWKILPNNKQRIFSSDVNHQLPTDLVNTAPNKYAVDESNSGKDKFALSLSGLEQGDEGIYACNIGHKTSETSITILEKLICESNSQPFKENGPLQLACSMKYYGPVPEMKATWHHNDHSFTSVKQDRAGVLHRALVLERATSGRYLCDMSAVRFPYTDTCATTVLTGEQPHQDEPSASVVKRNAPAGPVQARDDGTAEPGAGIDIVGKVVDEEEECDLSRNNVNAAFVGIFGITMLGLFGGIVYMIRYFRIEVEKYRASPMPSIGGATRQTRTTELVKSFQEKLMKMFGRT